MVVVFDFDKTLTDHDTLAGYYFYIGKKRYGYGNYIFRIFLYLLIMVLAKFRFLSNTQLKSLGIYLFLKNTKRIDLVKWNYEYAKTIKLNSIYQNIFLEKYPKAIIASASFSEYLTPIFPNNILISAKMSYNNDYSVDGLHYNCYGIEKVRALNQIGIDKIDIFYTDSFSDKPLMDISSQIFLVKKGVLQEFSL